MSSDFFASLRPLAIELDGMYSTELDRLANHIRDTAHINQQVSELLELEDKDFIPLSGGVLTPRDLHFAFAKALATKVLPGLSKTPTRDGNRIRDLIDWSDAPRRSDMGEQDFIQARIEHARSKSMEEFLKQLVIRFKPDALPVEASICAISDILSVFGTHTAVGLSLPVKHRNGEPVVRYVMKRVADEPMWQVLPRHHAAITKGTHAMATLALLNQKHNIAMCMSDMLTQMDVRLTKTVNRYEAGESFYAGTFMKMFLQRDGADFHVGQSLFSLLQSEFKTKAPEIFFVFH